MQIFITFRLFQRLDNNAKKSSDTNWIISTTLYFRPLSTKFRCKMFSSFRVTICRCSRQTKNLSFMRSLCALI